MTVNKLVLETNMKESDFIKMNQQNNDNVKEKTEKTY